MKKRGKKGQATLFIILAIVIIALAVLIYAFYPKIKSQFSPAENPYNFIQNCLQEEMQLAAQTLSVQGGSIAPEHYIVYNGENIEYLCYTNENYLPCVMQQPMLKEHIEEEIKNSIDAQVKSCFDELEENYKNSYDVNLRRGGFEIELLPKRVVASFNHSLTLTKDGSQNYNEFRVVLNNNLYELVSIANSILNWEAKYGDAETTTYMNYYRDLKVEKKKQIEGSKIYILTDTTGGNKFQFATRGLVWPPGYG